MQTSNEPYRLHRIIPISMSIEKNRIKAHNASCPCGRSANYDDCCGRLHAGEAAPTPEALMRSRYSAYALALEPYLLATWHASTRPASLGLADEDAVHWLELEIRHCEPATAHIGNAEHATVQYLARYKTGGRAHRLHETSRFVCEDGRWFYVDGDIAPASGKKTGRR